MVACMLGYPGQADESSELWSLKPLQEDFLGGIDPWLNRGFQQMGLPPNPLADRYTWIRRATFDLTGLPPSPEEIIDFVEDASDHAYARLIDRLLASPRYGERLNRLPLKAVGQDAYLESRIASFELAFRMQMEAPRWMDLSGVSSQKAKLYGMDSAHTERFARQCLLAARLSEAGVRFVQCSHAYWDQHSQLKKDHQRLAAEVDKPIAGLLQDLKARGLLEDTLVIWGGEFGRTPTAQGKDGRDHNPHAFTWWMAGGGVRGGFSHGATDEYGYYAVRDKVHVHDLHATILHLLGLDHERLTYRYAGRDFRLTDVDGKVVQPILRQTIMGSQSVGGGVKSVG